ncbi:hypothetical protein [Microbacterium sp. Root553]|uniref:hypothetical protein n=1 Tax=Microbacterium sp. Root553 TaxID=1736556 RepID=UPI000AD8C0E9|nr:hypothetical protein [Microbacterium sp. Root553]
MTNPDALANSQESLPEKLGEDRHESGPANVATPAESDARARILEHLEAREGEGDGELLYVGDTPAGGGGADSGGGATVRVDPLSAASVPNESAHNGIPGIGTRRSRRGRD